MRIPMDNISAMSSRLLLRVQCVMWCLWEKLEPGCLQIHIPFADLLCFSFTLIKQNCAYNKVCIYESYWVTVLKRGWGPPTGRRGELILLQHPDGNVWEGVSVWKPQRNSSCDSCGFSAANLGAQPASSATQAWLSSFPGLSVLCKMPLINPILLQFGRISHSCLQSRVLAITNFVQKEVLEVKLQWLSWRMGWEGKGPVSPTIPVWGSWSFWKGRAKGAWIQVSLLSLGPTLCASSFQAILKLPQGSSNEDKQGMDLWLRQIPIPRDFI